MKGSVSPEDFSTFKSLLINYKKYSISFDELVVALKKLLIIENKLKHLFIGKYT